MRRPRMPLVEKDCKTFPKAIITRGCLVKKTLLRFTGQIGPKAHNCKAKCILEMMFVVGCHYPWYLISFAHETTKTTTA